MDIVPLENVGLLLI